jgi:hypothetical protein
MTVLARVRSNCKRQTSPIVRESDKPIIQIALNLLETPCKWWISIELAVITRAIIQQITLVLARNECRTWSEAECEEISE